VKSEKLRNCRPSKSCKFRNFSLFVVIFSLVLGGLAWRVFSGRDGKVAKDERVVICHEVITAAQCICDCLGGVTNGLNVLKVDARHLDCNGFFKSLAGVPDGALVWMPGEFDWLVTWPADGCRISLSDFMDRYAALENADELAKAGCDSVPAVFASYVGTVLDVRPAFAQLAPDEMVVPELFVTKTLPVLDNFDFGGLDDDVKQKLKDEIRSRQNVRRVILEGCIHSRKGEKEAAVAAWARAAKRHANDTMLVERLDHLRTNGEVFYKLGKAAMAAQCYDVMAQIRPNDPVPVFNYGVCAQRLGRADLAEKAFERARKLDAGRTVNQGKLR